MQLRESRPLLIELSLCECDWNLTATMSVAAQAGGLAVWYYRQRCSSWFEIVSQSKLPKKNSHDSRRWWSWWMNFLIFIFWSMVDVGSSASSLLSKLLNCRLCLFRCYARVLCRWWRFRICHHYKTIIGDVPWPILKDRLSNIDNNYMQVFLKK